VGNFRGATSNTTTTTTDLFTFLWEGELGYRKVARRVGAGVGDIPDRGVCIEEAAS
jgi:hypothetical protein